MGIGKDTPEMSIQNLLVPYRIPNSLPPPDYIRKKLEKKLEEVRQILIRTNLMVRVTPDADNKYSATMASKKKVEFLKDTEITCWPIMLSETYERDLSPLANGMNFLRWQENHEIRGRTILFLTGSLRPKAVLKSNGLFLICLSAESRTNCCGSSKPLPPTGLFSDSHDRKT